MYQTGAQIIQASYWKAVQDSDTARKDEASKLLDYYSNGQIDYIREYIKQTCKERAKSIYPVCLNIIRKVINNLAMVYLQDAVRSIDGTDRDQEILCEIETSASLPVKMKQTNRLTKLLGTVLLRPVWRGGRMDMDVLTPDVLDVETGDTPEELESVTITHYSPDGDANAISYSYWTPEIVQTLDAMGRVTSEEPNPYGILPFVPCWKEPPTDFFWQRGARDLMSVQDGINNAITLLVYDIEFQGFGLLFGKRLNDVDSEISKSNIIASPGQLWHSANADADLKYISPNGPIEQILASVNFFIKQAAMLSGLPASVMSTEPSDQSGVARIVGNRELEELRADDIALFIEYERKLFEVNRVVWNVHNPGRKISDGAVFQINFYDPKPTTTGTEQAALWEKLLGMGVISPVDIIMERDPDLTREEATARLIQIRDEIAEFQKY